MLLDRFLPDFITREAPTFPNHITIKHSQRARRASLRLNPQTACIDLTIPSWMSLHEAYRFAETQKDWIEKTLSKTAPPAPFTDGQSLPILGKAYTLRISAPRAGQSVRTRIMLDADINELIVSTLLEDPAPRIEAYLKNHAKTHFTQLAQEKAARLNKAIKSLSLRDPKSRWGSCAEDGRIMLSWRLIFAPPAAMDYVIAHEVAHLQHMDHSPAFWTLCESLSHQFTEGSHWMRTHGNTLMRYGRNL